MKYHSDVKNKFILFAIVGLSILIMNPTSSFAKDDGQNKNAAIAQIAGVLDKPNEELIINTIEEAHKLDSEVIVLQLQSSTSANFDFKKVQSKIKSSKIPVVIWVGPKVLDDPIDEFDDYVDFYGEASEKKSVSETEINNPSLRGFIIDLNGKTARGKTIESSKVQIDKKQEKDQVDLNPVFYDLTISKQIRHSFIRSWTVLFLLGLGFLLILFEYYSASIGLAGSVGVVCMLGAIYGASQLNVNWMFGLLCVGLFIVVFDVQAGGLGFWSGISSIIFIIAGKYFVVAELQMSWIQLLVLYIGFIVFVAGAIPSMMRTRFGTPTIGREHLIGQSGEVIEDVSPEGIIKIDGAIWKARTNKATPIKQGEDFVVEKIEGIELIINPAVGAAKDYRER
jgi:membrane-bound ClpP family serine protease